LVYTQLLLSRAFEVRYYLNICHTGKRNFIRAKIAIYEPGKQRGTVAGALEAANSPPEIAPAIFGSFGKNTPDMLLYAKPFKRQTAKGTEHGWGTLKNIVDPNDPTGVQSNSRDVKKLLIYNYEDQILVAPIEVTTSTNYGKINDKIEKFEEGYRNPFAGNPKIAYVPVLFMDRNVFTSLPSALKADIVNRMRAIGGVVPLGRGFNDLAKSKAKSAAKELTSAIQSNRRNIKEDEKEQSDNVTDKINLVSVESRFATQSISSSDQQSSNAQKNTEVTYEKVVRAVKSASTQLQDAGIKTNDQNDLNIMVAVKSITSGLDSQQLLRHSPTYFKLTPEKGNVWIKETIAAAQKLLEQPSITSSASQKIFQDYKNTVSNIIQKNGMTEFEKYANIVRSYEKNLLLAGLNINSSSDLHTAIAAVIINAGQDPKTILQQSPAYNAAKNGKALLDSWIGKAQSALNPTTSSSIQKNNQHGGMQL
jgi:hypothetical protein